MLPTGNTSTVVDELIVEARNPGKNRPKFPVKFGVAEEEPDGPRVGLTKGPSKHTPTIPVPLVASRCGASLKQEKPSQARGL